MAVPKTQRIDVPAASPEVLKDLEKRERRFGKPPAKAPETPTRAVVDPDAPFGEEELKLIANRRKQLKDKFRQEQLPLLEAYLRVEVLQQRLLHKCLGEDATSADYKKLDDVTKLQLSMADNLQITPKEERKVRPPEEATLEKLLQRAYEYNSKQATLEAEETEFQQQRGMRLQTDGPKASTAEYSDTTPAVHDGEVQRPRSTGLRTLPKQLPTLAVPEGVLADS